MTTSDLQIVSLLDVLGFESLLGRLALAGLQQKYTLLVDYVKQQTGGIDIVPTPDGRVAVGWLILGNAYFSDSLLFWTNYSKMALPSFTHLVSEALFLASRQSSHSAGAIAVGEAILDTSTGVFLGVPLTGPWSRGLPSLSLE